MAEALFTEVDRFQVTRRTTTMTNRPRCGRLTVNYAHCPVFVRHQADACPRHAAHEAGPFIFEIDAQARCIAELTNTSKAYALGVIYDGPREYWRPEHLPGALLRAMYLTAALRLGMSPDVARATMPSVASVRPD